MHSGRRRIAGRPPNVVPTIATAKAATTHWPSAPMLNSPARKPSATASPVKTSGVARKRTWPMP